MQQARKEQTGRGNLKSKVIYDVKKYTTLHFESKMCMVADNKTEEQ